MSRGVDIWVEAAELRDRVAALQAQLEQAEERARDADADWHASFDQYKALQALLDEAREALERLCERNVTGTVPISAVREVLSRLQAPEKEKKA